MVKKIFSFLLIISSLISIIKTDLPVHCTSDQSFGKWKFHLYGRLFKPLLFNEKSTCGHDYPGKTIIESEKEQAMPKDLIKTFELELKNDFTVYENGEKVGKWTNVYDQSFIVYYRDSVFYAHYRYYTLDGYSFISNCDRTMNGWFTLKEYESNDNDNQLMGCFFGEKIKNENNDDEILLLNPPKKKIDKKILKNIKMKDLLVVVDEINNSNLTWKAKINPDDLDMNFYDYYKKYFDTKNEIFQDNNNEEEEKDDYNKDNNNEKISLRNLEQSQLIVNEFISRFRHFKTKKKLGINNNNSEENNNNLREPDSHYITNKEEILKYINSSLDEIDEKTLPKNWDWRDVGGENYYSEEISQGGCGSCYVVSTISILESRLRIKTLNKDQTKLSVKFPLSCSFYTEGCDGGFPIVLGKFFHDFEIVPRECFEYDQNDHNCENVCDYNLFEKKYFVTDYGYIGGFYGAATEVLMMKELRARGPITGNIKSPLFFSMFSGGIFSSQEIKENASKGLNNRSLYNDNIFFQELSHSTTIVGYGEENGIKYWICMNSYGKDWGENGYYKVLRGENEIGIESMSEYMNIDFVKRKKESY